jgi:putative transposase
MLIQRKPQSITMSAQLLLEYGLTKEKLILQKQMEGIGDMEYQKTLNLATKMEIISTQEFLQKNKKEICKDKLIFLRENIQISKLSQILEVDLTSKDKVSEKYWNNYSKEISEKLSFPHQIDFQDLELENSLGGFSSILEQDLQYYKINSMRVLTKNLPKTYLKLSQSSPPDITEDVNTQITRKVRIYPNLEQKKLFSKCFGAHRYFYNKAIEQFSKTKKVESFITVRNQVIVSNKDLTQADKNLWMEDIPYDTRQLAVKVAITARKAALSNLRNGNIEHFKMRYISKKTSNNVFYINKKALINGCLFKQKLKKSSLLKSKKDYETIDQSIGDFLIKQERDGRYYICVVIEPIDKILEPKENICALDPGVRTFQTMYSQESIGEFGFDTSQTLVNLYRREDKLKSVLTRVLETPLNSKKKYKLKKRCALLRTKIKHIVKDLHWKTADYLTKNFQVILLPIFNSKQMANKNKRKLSKLSTRLLLGLSHYDFQQKLLYKAKQRGRNVVICKEHYTTKCCGKCGTLNEKIGGKKIFHCNSCNLTMDRDIHAARNILLRGLTIYSDNLLGMV